MVYDIDWLDVIYGLIITNKLTPQIALAILHGDDCSCFMCSNVTTMHTPGPWQAYAGHDDQFLDEPLILRPLGRGVPDEAVARVIDTGNQKTTDANARLIAAAPALLEALQALLPESWEPGDYLESRTAALAKARAAIAQATGEAVMA